MTDIRTIEYYNDQDYELKPSLAIFDPDQTYDLIVFQVSIVPNLIFNQNFSKYQAINTILQGIPTLFDRHDFTSHPYGDQYSGKIFNSLKHLSGTGIYSLRYWLTLELQYPEGINYGSQDFDLVLLSDYLLDFQQDLDNEEVLLEVQLPNFQEDIYLSFFSCNITNTSQEIPFSVTNNRTKFISYHKDLIKIPKELSDQQTTLKFKGLPAICSFRAFNKNNGNFEINQNFENYLDSLSLGFNYSNLDNLLQIINTEIDEKFKHYNEGAKITQTTEYNYDYELGDLYHFNTIVPLISNEIEFEPLPDWYFKAVFRGGNNKLVTNSVDSEIEDEGEDLFLEKLDQIFFIEEIELQGFRPRILPPTKLSKINSYKPRADDFDPYLFNFDITQNSDLNLWDNPKIFTGLEEIYPKIKEDSDYLFYASPIISSEAQTLYLPSLYPISKIYDDGGLYYTGSNNGYGLFNDYYINCKNHFFDFYNENYFHNFFLLWEFINPIDPVDDTERFTYCDTILRVEITQELSDFAYDYDQENPEIIFTSNLTTEKFVIVEDAQNDALIFNIPNGNFALYNTQDSSQKTISFTYVNYNLEEDLNLIDYSKIIEMSEISLFVDSARTKEIHATLQANIYAQTTDLNTGEIVPVTHGISWKIDKLAQAWGISFDLLGNIIPIRQSHLVEDSDFVDEGYYYGQFGVNQGGSNSPYSMEGGFDYEERLGIIYEIKSNRFSIDKSTGEPTLAPSGVILCENIPQWLHVRDQDLNKALDWQGLGAYVVPNQNYTEENDIQHLRGEGLAYLLKENLVLNQDTNRKATESNIGILKTQGAVNEIFASLGVMTIEKTITVGAGGEIVQITYPALNPESKTIVDFAFWQLENLAMINQGTVELTQK